MLLAAPFPFFFLVGILLAVGVISWRRTRALRGGALPQAREPPGQGSFRSSRATFIAALAGVASTVWGAAAATDSRIESVPLVVAGLFVAVTGSVRRVTALQAGHHGLVIRHAGGPPFHAAWADLRALKPPASPLHGWRLTEDSGCRSSLMPSDLFGHEAILPLIVLRAGLRFDGREWTRDDATHAPSRRRGSGISPLRG